MTKHQDFLDKWLGKRYAESPSLWHQCVWLVKLYCSEVLGVKWLTFGGYAINGWNWKWNLLQFFDKVEVPQQCDVAFFHPTPTNKYWHVWIHDTMKLLLEQNGGKWSWTGLWVDAIRLWKYPTNVAGYMRLKQKPMPVIIQQGKHPDCSLASALNCYILNSWVNASKITQNVANAYFEEYVAKNPKDAYYFLKDKQYDIKYIPVSVVGTRNLLKKGRTIICRRKYMYRWWHDLEDDGNVNETQEILVDSKRWHFFCLKQEWDVVWAYDSNYPKRYKCEWERFVKAGVISKTFYQIR